MKKLVVCFVLASCTLGVAHAATTNTLNAAERAARKAKSERMMMKTTGGMVTKPGTGKGRIVIVNTQKRVDTKGLPQVFGSLRKLSHLPIEFKEGEAKADYPTVKSVREIGADIAVFIVDLPSCPSTVLVSPEERWSLVNVAALTKDSPSSEVLVERTKKEALRAFGWVAGAANSQSRGTVMGPVASYVDLDGIVLMEYPVDSYKPTLAYLHGMGVEPVVVQTYKHACVDGWAPSPTNEYQKAIWDKIHEIPTKPMKIVPESQRKK